MNNILKNEQLILNQKKLLNDLIFKHSTSFIHFDRKHAKTIIELQLLQKSEKDILINQQKLEIDERIASDTSDQLNNLNNTKHMK